MPRGLAGPSPSAVLRHTCVFLTAGIPALAFAQPTTAPDELNEAILRYAFQGEAGRVRLFPGRVPDDLSPNFHAPAGTRVIGTVIMGSRALVLAQSTAPVDSLRLEYARALGPRGWKPLERYRPSGFVPAGAVFPLIFCREGAYLQVRHTRRASGPYDLYLEYRDGAGMCDEPVVARRTVIGPASEASFPTLYDPTPPLGSASTRCRWGGPRGGGMTTTTTVASDSSADAVLRHYARQLEAGGWRVPAGGASYAMAGGRWSRPDSAGTAEVTLGVNPHSGPGCYEIEMRVSRFSIR